MSESTEQRARLVMVGDRLSCGFGPSRPDSEDLSEIESIDNAMVLRFRSREALNRAVREGRVSFSCFEEGDCS